MAKPVQIRASYRDDVAFLIRLEKAVEKDDRQDGGWRQETCNDIRSLYKRLLTARADQPEDGPKAARKK